MLRIKYKQPLIDNVERYLEGSVYDSGEEAQATADRLNLYWGREVAHWVVLVGPRIQDLPEPERVPFHVWLTGQTRPVLDDLPMGEQDGYYPHDYVRWKHYLETGLEVWD
jgi:hypothetical protein